MSGWSVQAGMITVKQYQSPQENNRRVSTGHWPTTGLKSILSSRDMDFRFLVVRIRRKQSLVAPKTSKDVEVCSLSTQNIAARTENINRSCFKTVRSSTKPIFPMKCSTILLGILKYHDKRQTNAIFDAFPTHQTFRNPTPVK